MYILLNYVWNVARSSEKKRFLVVDEAWNIMQYEDSVRGGNSQLRLYKRNILTRYFLDFGSYAEFPIEKHFLISDKLIDNKFIIYSQSLPKIYGDLENEITFKKIMYYSEGGNSTISSFDLDYRNL